MTTEQVEALLGAAAISVPLIVYVMAGIKTILSGEYAKYYPAMALTLGIILNVAGVMVFGGNYGLSIFVGMLAGFGAAKTYERGSTNAK
jgi:hypothetical protein